MEEKQNLSMKKMHQSKWKQVLVFVISMTVLLLIYSLLMEQIEKRFEVKADNFSWVYQIDSIEHIDNSIVLSGFAFELEQDAQKETFELILYDVETEKGYYPKMEYSDREDVNQYFLCEYDYTKSGFTAKIPSKKLDLENGIYEILLRPIGDKKAYATGTYYANGEMYFTNPKEFESLDIVGTDLEKVVEEGVLRVYRPDFGMYVYQYEGELYWIAEEWYGFNENNDIYVQFQMNTTQIQNLPKDRLENNWFSSNLGFRFKAKELVNWNTAKYRVTRCALPKEYSLTKIWTGYYKEGWIWKSDFRPWYEFSNQ